MVTLTSQVVAAGVRAGLLIENYPTVAALLASTGAMTEGDEVIADGHRYIVAATGANDHHLTTAGGVKLYVQPDKAGGYNIKAFGAAGDGTTDDAAFFVLDFDELVIDAGTYRIASNTTVTAMLRFLQGGKIKPDDDVTVTLDEGYQATDWQHVFDISAGGKVVGNRAAMHYITPQHFGALADAANDDAPAIQAACSYGNLRPIRDDFSGSMPVGFPAPTNASHYYLVSATVYIHRNVKLFGMGGIFGRYESSVQIRGANGLMAVMIFLSEGSAATASDGTGPSAYEPSNPAHNDEWKVYNGTSLFVCKEPHTASSENEPGVGASWTTYWQEFPTPSLIDDATLHADAWVSGTSYKTSPGFGLTGSAGGSHVVDLSFRPVTTGQVRFGVVHNCVVYFERCSSNYFEQAGFYAVGQTDIGYAPLINITLPVGSANSPSGFARIYSGTAPVKGNVNGSRYSLCRASGQTAGHGFVCAGNNAGAVTYESCDATGNAGAGFVDNSSVGSYYVCNHTAQNTLKVARSGTIYMCIKGHTSDTSVTAPGTGSDWRRYWVPYVSSETTVSDVDWADATFYVPCGAVNVSAGALGFATILSHYSEGGIEKGIVPRDSTQVIGGSVVSRVGTGQGPQGCRVVDHPEFEGAMVLHQDGMFLGGFGSVRTADPYGTPYEVGIYSGAYSSTGAINSDRILGFGDTRDDPATWQTIRLSFSNTPKAYMFVRGSASTTPLMGFSGVDFNRGGYTGGNHLLAPTGLLVGAGNANTSNYVKLAAVNASDASGAATALSGQTVVRGQRWYFTSATAGGAEGVVCTTAGVVGTDAVLKAFGSITS